MRPRWTNMLGNHKAVPTSVETVHSVADVVRVLDGARRNHETVRVIGAGAGWSALLAANACLLSMKGMQRVRSVDPAKRTITVEAGATILQATQAARAHGLSLMSPSMYAGLSVGGLIATGSHGTGKFHGTFGDGVIGFELVTADGQVITVDRPGSDLWRAVLCNLGALGVLTAVTLQCEPYYHILEEHHLVPSAEAAALLPGLHRDYEFVSAFWHPSSSVTVFKVGNRTHLPAEPVHGRLDPNLGERCASWFGDAVPVLARRIPMLNEVVSDLIVRGLGRGSRVVEEPYFSHYQQVYPAVISSEFAIPVEHTEAAWRWMYERLMQYWKAGKKPVNLVMHARFGRPSDALIASSTGRATCHLEVLSFHGNPDKPLFDPEFDAQMRGHFQGRPHWGKEMANPWKAAETHGENMERFLEIRHQLDPEQRFLNAFLRDDILGMGRRARRGTTQPVTQPSLAAE